MAVAARRLCRRGTIATTSSSQSDGESHGCAAHTYPMARASRSVSTTCKRCDGHHQYPGGCPNWRRRGRRILLAPPSAAGALQCTSQALHRWSDVKAQVDPCRTWRRGWSTPPPSDRHLGVRGCMLHPGAIPRHLAIQTGNSRPTAAACRVHNGTPSGARREVVSECCRRRIRKAAPVSAERQ